MAGAFKRTVRDEARDVDETARYQPSDALKRSAFGRDLINAPRATFGAEVKNLPARPMPWSRGIEEMISLPLQGYGAGQLLGEGAQALQAGDYPAGAFEMILGTMGLFPGYKFKDVPDPRQMNLDLQGGAFGTRSVPMSRGDNMPAKPEIKARDNLNSIGLYSALDEAVQSATIGKRGANAQSWMNAIKKGPNVKQEEVKWRGLDKWLNEQGARADITKDEVMSYLDANKVDVRNASAEGRKVKKTKPNREILDDDDAYSDWMDDARERARESYRETVEQNYSWSVEVDESRLDDMIDEYVNNYTVEKVKVHELSDEDLNNLSITPDDFDAGDEIYIVRDDNDSGRAVDWGIDEDKINESLRSQAREYYDETDQIPYEILDDDGDTVSYGFTSRSAAEEDMYERMSERADQDAYEWVRTADDEDIVNELGVELPLVRTNEFDADEIARLEAPTEGDYQIEPHRPVAENYMRDAPEGRGAYSEPLYTVDKATLERVGSGGRPAPHGGHPDSNYDNALTWRLEHAYPSEALGRGKGTAAHELQGDWAQQVRRAGGAFDPERVAKLTEERDALRPEYEANKNKFMSGSPTTFAELGLPRTYQPGESGGYWHGLADDVRRALDYRTRATRAGDLRDQYLADIPYGEVDSDQARTLAYRQYDYESYARQARHYLNNLRNPEENYDFRPVLPDTPQWDEYQQWSQSFPVLEHRYNELQDSLTKAQRAPHGGPFIEDNEAWPLSMKTGLYEAAKRGDDWFAISGPRRVTERWHATGQDDSAVRRRKGYEEWYGRKGPNILQKVINMIDPKAKLEDIYPAGEDSRGGSTSSGAEPSGSFDLGWGEWPSQLNQRPPMLQALTPEGTWHRPVTPRLARDSNGTPYYQLVDDTGNYTGLTLATADNAEAAARQINESLMQSQQALANPSPPSAPGQTDPSRAISDWSGGNVQEPYKGVLLTPELREKIVKRGFPMFVQGGIAGAGLGAFAARGPLDDEDQGAFAVSDVPGLY